MSPSVEKRNRFTIITWQSSMYKLPCWQRYIERPVLKATWRKCFWLTFFYKDGGSNWTAPQSSQQVYLSCWANVKWRRPVGQWISQRIQGRVLSFKFLCIQIYTHKIIKYKQQKKYNLLDLNEITKVDKTYKML